MSETPRVDELAHFGAWGSPGELKDAYVHMVDLARQLERELAEAHAAIRAAGLAAVERGEADIS